MWRICWWREQLGWPDLEEGGVSHSEGTCLSERLSYRAQQVLAERLSSSVKAYTHSLLLTVNSGGRLDWRSQPLVPLRERGTVIASFLPYPTLCRSALYNSSKTAFQFPHGTLPSSRSPGLLSNVSAQHKLALPRPNPAQKWHWSDERGRRKPIPHLWGQARWLFFSAGDERDVKEPFLYSFLENFMSFCLFFLFSFFLWHLKRTNNGNLMVYTSLFSLIIIKTYLFIQHNSWLSKILDSDWSITSFCGKMTAV